MPTKLEVINSALRAIAEPAITDVDSTQPRAVAASAQWPFALEEFLGAGRWWWAKMQASLTAASPAPSFGWESRYALPTTFVSILKLNGEDVRGEESDWFELFSGYLHTDETEAQIEYVAKPHDGSALSYDTFTTVTLLSRMPGYAMQPFVTLLASKLANPHTKDGRILAERLLGQYRLELSAAVTRAANEGRRPWNDPASQSRFVAARRRGPAG